MIAYLLIEKIVLSFELLDFYKLDDVELFEMNEDLIILYNNIINILDIKLYNILDTLSNLYFLFGKNVRKIEKNIVCLNCYEKIIFFMMKEIKLKMKNGVLINLSDSLQIEFLYYFGPFPFAHSFLVSLFHY